MTKEIFLELNKGLSGCLSQERYIKNNYPVFHREIIEYTQEFPDECFKEKIFRFLNKDLEEKICVCGGKRKLLSILLGYQEFCNRSCANKHTSERIKKVKEERYGDANYNNPDLSRIAHMNTLTIRGKEVLEKRRETRLKKYGDANYTNREKAKDSRKTTTLLEINEKIKDSTLSVVDVLSDSSYLIYCNKCLKTQKINNSTINARIRNNINPCPTCFNYSTGRSAQEDEILNFIEELNLSAVRGRRILDGYEIDIFLPELMIGIEYNGLFWHSEFKINKDYHLNKTIIAERLGIKLIHIWEDDWFNKKEIVKSRLLNLFGKNNLNIYARECEIREIDFNTTKNFLEGNHLQGSCPSKVNLGLYFKGELVSLSTFGTRKISGSSDNELLRFCNKINTNVVGGFSKLLKNYIKKYDPIKIITFADRCWTNSKNVYEISGFKFVGETTPNYYYLVNHKREHRFKFRKDVLIREGYDPEKTEREIMLEREIYRIYDCGNYKYEWKKGI